jgi:GNAT superfamily N-acetyltransferase
LDDFFLNDADNYNRQLLGKSYCYRLKDDLSVIVCAFTLAYSAVDVRRLPNSRRKKVIENIPHEKTLSSYPAVLVCRLGVNVTCKNKGIGTELMKFIKQWFIDSDTKGGCRYLTVDAYNNDVTRQYYTANGFKDIFSTEQQEKDYLNIPPEKELKSRIMFFDLIQLKIES